VCTVPACEWADIRTADVNQDFGADVRWRISRCTRFTTLRFQARVFVVALSTDVWPGSCPALFLACAWAFFRVSGPTCWAGFLDALFEIRFIPSFEKGCVSFVVYTLWTVALCPTSSVLSVIFSLYLCAPISYYPACTPISPKFRSGCLHYSLPFCSFLFPL